MSDNVRIVEVGPRDGLQNEPSLIPIDTRIALVNALSEAGLRHIEAGSFVSARWVPQMADSDQVLQRIRRAPGARYSALTPNLQGFEAALSAGADEVAVFTAASESFTRKNINCSIEESLERFQPVLDAAAKENLRVRAYVSCVWGCPYEGRISPDAVLQLTERLLAAGCYEVSLGDTIGVATSGQVDKLLRLLLAHVEADRLAMHFHDTYGQALANIDRSLDHGIRTLDASVAGLGGCPYAKGASGNVSTEDLVYLLHGNGLQTGINLERLIDAGHRICTNLGRPNGSKVAMAYRGKPHERV